MFETYSNDFNLGNAIYYHNDDFTATCVDCEWFTFEFFENITTYTILSTFVLNEDHGNGATN